MQLAIELIEIHSSLTLRAIIPITKMLNFNKFISFGIDSNESRDFCFFFLPADIVAQLYEQ